MARIFISYRREDSATITDRINDYFITHFGTQNVFRDIDTIPAGMDFRQAIENALASCEIMLVIIGSTWTSVTNEQGHKRLENPVDFVRLEVETGLRLPGVRVIPVLVHNAVMPEESELPSTLSELRYRNAVKVRNDPDFRKDIEKLVYQVTQSGTRKQEQRFDKRKTSLVIAALGLLVSIIIIYVALTFGDNQQSSANSQTHPAATSINVTNTSVYALAPTLPTDTPMGISTPTLSTIKPPEATATQITVQATASAQALPTLTQLVPTNTPPLPSMRINITYTNCLEINARSYQCYERTVYDISPSTPFSVGLLDQMLSLTEVYQVSLESHEEAFDIRFLVTNTTELDVRLIADESFFTLENKQGERANLVYFCCTTDSSFLYPGEEREFRLVFQYPGFTWGKEAFFRVEGFQQILRAVWRIPLPPTIE